MALPLFYNHSVEKVVIQLALLLDIHSLGVLGGFLMLKGGRK